MLKMLVIDRNLRLIAIICGALTAFIGGLALAGYIFGEYNFFSLGRNYYPMADESAVSLIILGLALTVAIKSRNNKKLHYFVVISSIAISVVAFLSLIDYATDYAYNLGILLIPEHEMLGEIPIGRMSFITALCFIFASTALLLLKEKTAKLSVIFSSVNLIIGYIIVFGYGSGVPFLYGGTKIPVALPAAIAIIILAIGLLASAGKNTFPQKYFLGTSTQAILMRKLIPAFLILIVVYNLFTIYTTGNYNTSDALNESVKDIILIIATGTVIWILSSSIGKSVDKNLTDRIVAEQELQNSLKTLTDKSAELAVKNKEWLDSRVATFNIMEDLIEAKKTLENVNKHLIAEISERKKAEAEMKKAFEKYKELFDASNDIIYTMDLNGNFTSVSPSAEKLLGYKLETLSNKNMMNFISEESAKTAFDNITKKINGDESNTIYEVGFNNMWGSVTDLEINSMIRFKEGQAIEVFGIARDVTEKNKFAAELLRNHDIQKVINELLRESLKKIPLDDILYKALEMLVSLPWLALDKKGAIFLTNADGNLSMKAYYGLSEAVINECKMVPAGKCLCGTVLKEKKSIYLSKIDHTHDINYQGMIDHGHYCIPIMDGENVLGLINTYLAPGHLYSEFEVEFITAVANTLSGIITRKKTENELQVLLNTLEVRVKDRTEDLIQSNELYLTTVNSLQDWIFVIDDKYNIVFINQIMKDFLINNGITDDVSKKNIKDVFGFLNEINPMHYDKVFKNCMEEISEGEYSVFGNKYYVQIKFSPIIHDNKVIRVVTTVHDLTKLKLIEEEIIKNLEREKELNALKSQFISTVSHEFRTPLAGILSSTQLLKRYNDKWDNVKKDEKYNQIFEAIKHTISMLDDVSLVNKGESNAITIRPVIVDLKELLLSIIEDNKHVYDPDFEIVTTFHLRQKEYLFDQEIIRHIVGNVISNALKYSGISKKIIFNVTEEKENILFNVIDYGIGIPLADQKHLFTPFHRASNVETLKGSGFGLSIVKRLVDLLNGTIEIKSEIDKGTTVNITLPILKIPEEENEI